MKKRFLILLLVLLSVGATIRFDWEPNDPAEEIKSYNLYEKIGTNYLLLTNVIDTTSTINVTPGSHVWALTATNIFGESDYTEITNSIPSLPSPPKKPITTIVIQVFVSP